MKKAEKVAYWRQQVDAFLASGLTVKHYCAQTGIPVATLHYWCKRFADSESTPLLALVILLMAGRLTVRTPGAQAVCALLDVPGRPLRGWQNWWRQDFPMISLWQAEVACYLPPVYREDLPHSLLTRFAGPL